MGCVTPSGPALRPFAGSAAHSSSPELTATLFCQLTCICLTGFAAYAIAFSIIWAPKTSNSIEALATLKGFIAIRNTQSMWRVAWSMFAGSMGAWCITAPADYASFAGWIGMLMYALATGLPLIFIAFFGQMIKDKYPRACSVGDYVAMRFGPAARFLVVLVALFNMLIFMLAEFTTIGSLFADFVGSVNYPIIIVIAVLTTGYTAWGGVLVSIVTDQVQACVSLLLLAIAFVYVLADFRTPLPAGFGDAAPLLAPNEAGYASIFTMPLSLLSATVFNEAMWQRVWAAESPKALYSASFIACFFVTIGVLLYGMTGFLVTWAGLSDENTNPNLLLFQVFKSSDANGPATVSNWISLLVLVLAAIMNQSAIDSLITGITGTIATYFLPGKSVNLARVLTAVITIPVCVLALWNGRVLSIFLTANMVGTCTFLPVVIGGFMDNDDWKPVLSETPYILSCITSVLVTTAYGVGRFWDPSDVAGAFARGASYAWYEHWYEWDYFLVALTSSLVSFFIFGGINAVLQNSGVPVMGIADILGCPSCMHTFSAQFVDEGTDAPQGKEADPETVYTYAPGMAPGMAIGGTEMPRLMDVYGNSMGAAMPYEPAPLMFDVAGYDGEPQEPAMMAYNVAQQPMPVYDGQPQQVMMYEQPQQMMVYDGQSQQVMYEQPQQMMVYDDQPQQVMMQPMMYDAQPQQMLAYNQQPQQVVYMQPQQVVYQ